MNRRTAIGCLAAAALPAGFAAAEEPDGPEPGTPFGDSDAIEAFCRLTPPTEVGEAERLLPVRLVPRFDLSPDESASR